MSKTDDLIFAIQDMTPATIRRQQGEIEKHLQHRSSLVRSQAAEALGRARVGGPAVRRALGREQDELVLASLCDTASLLDDRASVPLIKRLSRHPSWLVRKFVARTVPELEEAKATSFLQDLLAHERSRRVRPVLQAALFQLGILDLLPDLLANLGSRDYLVRCITANALACNIRRRTHRAEVVRALQAAHERETTVAASEHISKALAAWVK